MECPQLPSVNAVGGGEEERAADDRQELGPGLGRIGPDVLDEDGAGRAAIALPQLGAGDTIEGNEEQRAAHVRELGREGSGRARADVLDEDGAGGAVALPELPSRAVLL